MEDTHELTSTDLYSPRVAYESYVSSKTDSSFFGYDVDLLAVSGAVIIFGLLLFYAFSRYSVSSHIKNKCSTLPAGPDKKPDVQSEPDYFHLTLCVEGPADADDSVLSSLASRVVREAENLYIPGINRRDSTDGEFAWSVQTKFPSDTLSSGSRIFPESGWFERPNVIERPVKMLCICLQYTTQTPSSTLHSLVDEAGRQVAKAYLKGGHCHGSEGYTFCIR
ncbi:MULTISPECIES: hypothetical protein [Klebsiella pneumoniae complex]|uniref:hypothetical protein n=1 Tax=Klebsiella pneumoniae complex TaxID=3390273 RepID=UPI000945A0E9|nr:MULTISPECIES: hypothetical protein [Klebsiella]MCJ8559828.1 hypothetical protein [Klebsiella quasipneumoniae]MCR1231262.1 hypothetical protein [Klebsiella quasipneumoniae]MDE9114429.1 hypothetical protein [Klebsiella pneumoniae]MDE9164859.1 hypothetical protein [Klebsiella pneumoniae]